MGEVEIVYVGPLVSVVVPEHGSDEFPHGKPVKVAGALAERLLEQKANWAKAPRGRVAAGEEE